MDKSHPVTINLCMQLPPTNDVSKSTRSGHFQKDEENGHTDAVAGIRLPVSPVPIGDKEMSAPVDIMPTASIHWCDEKVHRAAVKSGKSHISRFVGDVFGLDSGFFVRQVWDCRLNLCDLKSLE